MGTKESQGVLPHALLSAQRIGGQHPAHTTGGRLEQALRWLDNPSVDDGGVGLQAVKSLADESRRLADQLGGADKNRLLGLSSDIDRLASQLAGALLLLILFLHFAF